LDVETSGFNERSDRPIWGSISHNPESITLNKKEINDKKVPNVIGMGAKDAVYLLESLGLKVQLTGLGKVKKQSIPAGNNISKGKTIQLKLQ
jgi:cell division protein FtsI (penicillin-binding protein 3)